MSEIYDIEEITSILKWIDEIVKYVNLFKIAGLDKYEKNDKDFYEKLCNSILDDVNDIKELSTLLPIYSKKVKYYMKKKSGKLIYHYLCEEECDKNLKIKVDLVNTSLKYFFE